MADKALPWRRILLTAWTWSPVRTISADTRTVKGDLNVRSPCLLAILLLAIHSFLPETRTKRIWPLPLLDPLLMPLAGADRKVGVLILMDQKPAPLACLPITMRMPFPCQSCSLAFNPSIELEARIHVCLGLCDPPNVMIYPAAALSTPLARPATIAPRTAEKASCHGPGERLVTGGSVAPSPAPTAALTSPALGDALMYPATSLSTPTARRALQPSSLSPLRRPAVTRRL